MEPGRDGVGDYTRRLAGELARQGHAVACVALNDLFVTSEFDGRQYSEGVLVPTLRLPTGLSESARFEHARHWIARFTPDWISLQFVPFSFHPKGLPLGLPYRLASLGKGCKWHVMLHELWVGMDTDAPLKHIWWGGAQRFIIKSLLSRLKPSVVHTQSHLYLAYLAELGVQAEHLPLFSNIPLLSTPLPETGERADGTPTDTLVLFGGIHPGAPVEDLAAEAAHYSRSQAIRVKLMIVGRCGTEQERWADVWRAHKLPVEIAGEQSAEQISAILRRASLGIATTPMALIEKSGAVSAMRAHGLTVLCVARRWYPRGGLQVQAPSGVIEYRKGSLTACLDSGLVQQGADNQSDVVSAQLSNRLLRVV